MAGVGMGNTVTFTLPKTEPQTATWIQYELPGRTIIADKKTGRAIMIIAKEKPESAVSHTADS